jgi:hypothetical protein
VDKSSIIASALVVPVLGFALAATHPAMQSGDAVVGTWKLTSADAFGDSPLGSLMLDRTGHFSAIFIRANLPLYASNSRVQGTTDEYRDTVNGSVAVFGTYKLDGDSIRFHIDGSTFPNWTGTDQTRYNVTVSNTKLEYTQMHPSDGGSPVVVVWQRVN